MVAAVGKAAALLRAYGPAVEVLSARQLAARTGIPRSTVHTLAGTLAAEGLLEAVPGRGYRLGSAAGRVWPGRSSNAPGWSPRSRARSDRCCARPGRRCTSASWSAAGWSTCTGRPGRCAPPMDNRVGLRAPAWRGGCGKAALARLPDAEVDARMRRLCREEGRRRCPTCPPCTPSWTPAGTGLPGQLLVPGRADLGRRGRWSGPAARSAGCRWPGRAAVHRAAVRRLGPDVARRPAAGTRLRRP